MGKRKPVKETPPVEPPRPKVPLVWVKAAYHLHTFSYRDPRVAYSSGIGLPVLSPTAVILGVVSTLFNLGYAEDAKRVLSEIDLFRAIVDPPDSAIFFRAFHQVRRYSSGIMKSKKADYKAPADLGLTKINQSTREHALVQGVLTLYVGTPEHSVESVALALRHRTHIGSRDSLCSLVGDVVSGVSEPTDVMFLEPEKWQTQVPMNCGPVTGLALSRFTANYKKPTVGQHWWLSGGDNTEIVPYLVQGKFKGTTRGKIYIKDDRIKEEPSNQTETP